MEQVRSYARQEDRWKVAETQAQLAARPALKEILTGRKRSTPLVIGYGVFLLLGGLLLTQGVSLGWVVVLAGVVGMVVSLSGKRYAEADGEIGQPTILTTYRGKQRDTARRFQADAVALARYGYRPVAQDWSPGQYRGIDFIVALLLGVVLIGIVIFIAMILVKPAGTLVVTYELAQRPVTPPSTSDLHGILGQLVAARDGGLISTAEYDAKRADVLARF